MPNSDSKVDKKLILNKIISHYKLKSKADLAHHLGIPTTTLSGWYSRNVIDYEIVCSKFKDINANWLITGQGSIYNSAIQTSPNQPVFIPLYDSVSMTGEQGNAVDISIVSEPIDHIDPGFWFSDADCVLLIRGESMLPDYKSGSYIILKEVKDFGLLFFDRDYVIETSEYRFLRRLVHSTIKGNLLANATNTDKWSTGSMAGRNRYEPIEVPLSDIKRLFYVLGVINRNTISIPYGIK